MHICIYIRDKMAFIIDTDLLLKLKNIYLRKETKENRCIHTAFGCYCTGFNKAYILEEIQPIVVSCVVFSIIGSIVGQKTIGIAGFLFWRVFIVCKCFQNDIDFLPVQ